MLRSILSLAVAAVVAVGLVIGTALYLDKRPDVRQRIVQSTERMVGKLSAARPGASAPAAPPTAASAAPPAEPPAAPAPAPAPVSPTESVRAQSDVTPDSAVVPPLPQPVPELVVAQPRIVKTLPVPKQPPPVAAPVELVADERATILRTLAKARANREALK